MQLHYLDISRHPHCKLSFPLCSLILCLFMNVSLPLSTPCLSLYPCRHPFLSVLSSSLRLVPLCSLIALPLGIWYAIAQITHPLHDTQGLTHTHNIHTKCTHAHTPSTQAQIRLHKPTLPRFPGRAISLKVALTHKYD